MTTILNNISMAHFMLAQTVDFKEGTSYVLGIIMIIGFVWGTIKIMVGADKKSKGDPDGMSSIIGGLLIAGAPAIMFALYVIFGLGDGAVTPEF